MLWTFLFSGIVLATSGIDNDIKLWSPTAKAANPLDDMAQIIADNREKAHRPEAVGVSIQMLYMFEILRRLERESEE